jgi:hypothetical protein
MRAKAAPGAETPDIVETVVKAGGAAASIAGVVAGADGIDAALKAAASKIMKGEGMLLGVVAGATACDAHRCGRNGGRSKRVAIARARNRGRG